MDSTPQTPTTMHHHRRTSSTPTTQPSSPTHTYSPSGHRRRKSSRLSTLDNSLLSNAEAGNNLEDELADVWDDDEWDGHDNAGTSLLSPRPPDIDNFTQDPEKIRDSGIDVTSTTHSPPAARTSPSKHARNVSRTEPDLVPTEPGELPASLKAAMAAIEGLAKAVEDQPEGSVPGGGSGGGGTGLPTREVFADLGNQAAVEAGTSRLATAHAALATHIAHQTRVLHGLSFSLGGAWRFPTEEEHDEEVLGLIAEVLDGVPRPALEAGGALAALQACTRDAGAALHALSDSLHLARQASEAASRRLKSAREVVGGLVREDVLAEQGVRYIDDGGWDRRLRERESARACREVVQGFEQVCDGWREKLIGLARERGEEVAVS